ncbi:MAG: insulinase family protein [Alphaproteobacteria bacterium]|nr:insulinase family protein [Alphaproteobacteria bacterium]
MKKLFATLVMVTVAALPGISHANEVQIFTTDKGIHTWLIEDHHLPIVSMSFAWHGGVELDDEAKQGLSHLAADMLTKGAGNDDENVVQQKLQENAISLGFQAQRDTVYGQMRSLKDTLPIAQDLLHASMTSPRFDDKSISELKAETLSGLKRYQSDPDWMLSRLIMSETFAGHPYSKRTLGSQTTIASITKDDLKKWHQRLNREQLIVSITGDLTKTEASKLLDDTFGDLPQHAELASVPDADIKGKKQVFLVNYNGSQSSMMLQWPGISRQDKDWYAMQVMNYILGGGSFSSRLMNEIREKRGLTYGISSGMSLFDHAATYTIQASFKNENAGEVLGLVKKEIIRIRDTKVAGDELKAAKDYLIGAYGLNLTSTAQVAGHYLELQRQKLGTDDQHQHEVGIRAVTAEDVQRVAKRILKDDDMAAYFVGQPKGITPTQSLPSIE